MPSPPTLTARTIRKLERAIGYHIRCRDLFVQALLHRSFPQKNGASGISNERLEFLGDSILNLIVAEYLYATTPTPPKET